MASRTARTLSAGILSAIFVHANGPLDLFSLSAPGVAPAAADEVASEGRSRPPWPRYHGRPIEPIRGRTVLEGDHAKIDLPAALQGDLVRHDIVIHNDRDRPVELSDVEACSGCVLEGWPRRIPPGAHGSITIVLLTDSRGGDTVAGTVTARTDDPERPVITADVSMPVREFAALDPYRVWLRGRVGDPIVEHCIVTPNEAYPFEITGLKLSRGVWLDVAHEAIEHAGRRAYRITLTNTRTKPGPYQDVVYVQTDHPERPEFKIRVEGRLEPAP